MTAITGTKPEHYAKLNLTQGEIALWEDGLRTDPTEASFEWWYFDCVLPDGSKLTTEFHTKPPTVSPREPLTPFVAMTLDRADGSNVTRTYLGPADDFSASRERCDVRIGPNTFAGDLRHYEIHLDFDGVRADIVLEADVPSWRPATGHLLVDDDHYIAWLPSVPHGRVSGNLAIDGQPEPFEGGVGYHDHNWGNISLRKAVDHWYWGRARVGEYAVLTLNFVSHRDHGHSIHPAFMVARDGAVLSSGEHDVAFAATDVHPNPDTGVRVANRVVYEFGEYRVEFARRQDLFRLDFGIGAYHRFSGNVRVEHRVDDKVLDVAEGDGLWELLFFGDRKGTATRLPADHLVHRA